MPKVEAGDYDKKVSGHGTAPVLGELLPLQYGETEFLQIPITTKKYAVYIMGYNH